MRSVLDRQRHHRRSIRLQGYDYSRSGAYYVTLCTQDRACFFGEVVDTDMHLNDAGRLVSDAWRALPDRFPPIVLDAFVIMPNHIHGVVVIAGDNNPVGAGLVPALDVVPAQNAAPVHDGSIAGATTRVAPTLGDVIGAYKSMVTVQYTRAVHTRGWPRFRKRLWQRNYYEYVIRNAESLDRIRQYILDNPRCWYEDRYNPNVREGDE